MWSRIRTAVVCASVLTAAIGGFAVFAGAGGGQAGGIQNAPTAPAAGAGQGQPGEFQRVEAEVEFWKQEMRRLEAELGALTGEGGNPGSIVTARVELNHNLLRRAAEADQDARLRLHMAHWERQRSRAAPKKD